MKVLIRRMPRPLGLSRFTGSVGSGSDPRSVNLDKPSGRGILLMRTFMDEALHNDTGNEVTLIKRRNSEPTSRLPRSMALVSASSRAIPTRVRSPWSQISVWETRSCRYETSGMNSARSFSRAKEQLLAVIEPSRRVWLRRRLETASTFRTMSRRS